MKLLAFIYFFFFLRHGMLFPFIPLYAKFLGADAFSIGIVVSSFSLLSLFLAFPTGIITDRISTRFTLLLSVLLNSVYSFLLLLSKTIWLVVIAQFVGGIGFLFMIVGTQIYVSLQKEKEKREKGFGLVTFSAAVGQTFGPFLGGMLFEKVHFEGIFKISLSLALLGMLIFLLKDEDKKEEYPLTPKGMISIFKEILNPYMACVLIFCFVVLFAISLRSSFLPILLKENHISEKEIGILLSFFSFAMSVVRIFIGRLMGIFSRAALVKSALTLIGIGTIALPLLSSKVMFCLFISIIGLGFGISQPLSMVMVSDTVPVKYLGISFGIRFTTITLATVVGPFLSGILNQKWGINISFYVAGAFALVSNYFVVKLLKKS